LQEKLHLKGIMSLQQRRHFGCAVAAATGAGWRTK